MAVPSSGEVSLLKLMNELSDDDYDAGEDHNDVSLSDLSDGTVSSINTGNSRSDRPDGENPLAMSEFYSYDHTV